MSRGCTKINRERDVVIICVVNTLEERFHKSRRTHGSIRNDLNVVKVRSVDSIVNSTMIIVTSSLLVSSNPSVDKEFPQCLLIKCIILRDKLKFLVDDTVEFKFYCILGNTSASELVCKNYVIGFQFIRYILFRKTEERIDGEVKIQ